MLSERDRKIAEDRKKLRDSYKKELENQIRDQSERAKRYDEMDERNLTLNQRGLLAYETGERNPGLFNLPGINRENNDRDNYARYARQKQPSKMGIEMALNHPRSDVLSQRSGKLMSNNNHMRTIPYSQHKYKELPKTSIDEGLARGRRSSRDINSPNNPQNHKDEVIQVKNNYEPDRGMSKHKSMANIEKPNLNINQNNNNNNEIDVIKGSNSKLMSPRNYEEPEYEPTKRNMEEKRSLRHGGVSRSISNLGNYKEPKNVEFNEARHSRTDKFRKAPESILNIDSEINKRIMGALRQGNLSISKENMTLPKEGASTQREYESALP